MKLLGLILFAITVAITAQARLGENESDFNRKFFYRKQGEDFEGDKKVGTSFKVKKRVYQSKEPDAAKDPRTQGTNPLFQLTVTFVNGVSQHEEYWFIYNREVADKDIEAMKAANGGADNWTKTDTAKGGQVVFTRKDGKATMKVSSRAIELSSDVYTKLQQEEKKITAPQF